MLDFWFCCGSALLVCLDGLFCCYVSVTCEFIVCVVWVCLCVLLDC